MVNVFRPFLIACLVGGASVSTAAGPAAANQEGLVTLPGDLPEIANPVPGFRYDPNLTRQKFHICVPPGYDGRKPFGVLAFINAGDEAGLPPGWKGVLAQQRLLFIEPEDYRAKVFDVPGMGHEIPGAPTIRAAIAWLERGAAKPAAPPAASGTAPSR